MIGQHVPIPPNNEAYGTVVGQFETEPQVVFIQEDGVDWDPDHLTRGLHMVPTEAVAS